MILLKLLSLYELRPNIFVAGIVFLSDPTVVLGNNYSLGRLGSYNGLFYNGSFIYGSGVNRCRINRCGCFVYGSLNNGSCISRSCYSLRCMVTVVNNSLRSG